MARRLARRYCVLVYRWRYVGHTAFDLAGLHATGMYMPMRGALPIHAAANQHNDCDVTAMRRQIWKCCGNVVCFMRQWITHHILNNIMCVYQFAHGDGVVMAVCRCDVPYLGWILLHMYRMQANKVLGRAGNWDECVPTICTFACSPWQPGFPWPHGDLLHIGGSSIQRK